MRREDRFVMSRKPYAVDLSSLLTTRKEGRAGPFWYCSVRAVWFRRRRTGRTGPLVTVACVGSLATHQRPEPADGEAFLCAYTDGRYGGDCAARWDGTGYWGAEDPIVVAKHLELLRPMLDAYADNPHDPVAPAGFDGWWTFHSATGGTA